jgi:hypothetical protein
MQHGVVNPTLTLTYRNCPMGAILISWKRRGGASSSVLTGTSCAPRLKEGRGTCFFIVTKVPDDKNKPRARRRCGWFAALGVPSVCR